MQKKVKIICRESDPKQYSGIFKVKADFKFEKERELRLEDGRIIVIKQVGSNTRYLPFLPDCNRARDHKIVDLYMLHGDRQPAHT